MSGIDFNLHDIVGSELRRSVKRIALQNRYSEFCTTMSRCNIQIDAHSDVFEILRNYVRYKIDFDVLYYDELTSMANEIRDTYQQLKRVVLEDFKEFYELNKDFYQHELCVYLYRERDKQTKQIRSFFTYPLMR